MRDGRLVSQLIASLSVNRLCPSALCQTPQVVTFPSAKESCACQSFSEPVSSVSILTNQFFRVSLSICTSSVKVLLYTPHPFKHKESHRGQTPSGNNLVTSRRREQLEMTYSTYYIPQLDTGILDEPVCYPERLAAPTSSARSFSSS